MTQQDRVATPLQFASLQQCLPLQQAEVLLSLQELHCPFRTCHHHPVLWFPIFGGVK